MVIHISMPLLALLRYFSRLIRRLLSAERASASFLSLIRHATGFIFSAFTVRDEDYRRISPRRHTYTVLAYFHYVRASRHAAVGDKPTSNFSSGCIDIHSCSRIEYIIGNFLSNTVSFLGILSAVIVMILLKVSFLWFCICLPAQRLSHTAWMNFTKFLLILHIYCRAAVSKFPDFSL